jgi:transposase InsO family protein
LKQFPVNVMCGVLRVSRSGFYAWQRRQPSAGACRRAELTERIRQVHRQSRAIYGAPRVHRELAAAAVRCSKNTVAKLMRQAGLRSKMHKRVVVRTTDSRHAHPIAVNRLNRQFQQAQPDQAWAADITYIPTGEGWLYLAALIDLCSRKIVGWATSDSLASEVACQALQMAVLHRRPCGPVLHHSDRGVQYACDEYQRLLGERGLQASMSRVGNCYDNAVMESFFGTLKTELVHHEAYPTRAAARQSLFEYIEVFYNRQRRHSTLGYVSPQEYEQALAPTFANLAARHQGDNLAAKPTSSNDRDHARPGKGLTGRQSNTTCTTLTST